MTTVHAIPAAPSAVPAALRLNTDVAEASTWRAKALLAGALALTSGEPGADVVDLDPIDAVISLLSGALAGLKVSTGGFWVRPSPDQCGIAQSELNAARCRLMGARSILESLDTKPFSDRLQYAESLVDAAARALLDAERQYADAARGTR